ncbi:hypothetical protein [Teichococcus aestuarii]|uniref:Uncharacterized protein n=1 Tax=Teichococcus aestuarii TaxID=568898 RepID=A0A2U1V857_9PROT|nr:hypothetical protein [Pseudoroseomonas aestuarii]PWC30065.1 hypothetical protein CR165_04165 [Pseudoroseomonas aestuarii]
MVASNPVLLGFLLVLGLFAMGATLAGLLLERAARHPRAAAGVVVAAMFGLSWGGILLLRD